MKTTNKDTLASHAAETLGLAAERLGEFVAASPDASQLVVLCEAQEHRTRVGATTRGEVFAMLAKIGDAVALKAATSIRQKNGPGEIPLLYMGRLKGDLVVQTASAFPGLSDGGEA